MNDGTSQHIRDLVAAVSDRPQELPVSEIVHLATVGDARLKVDLSTDPAVVYMQPERHPAFATLTKREEDVARLIAAGYSNQQIADALFISLATAKDHVHSILRKTDFRSRSQVVAGWLGSTLR